MKICGGLDHPLVEVNAALLLDWDLIVEEVHEEGLSAPTASVNVKTLRRVVPAVRLSQKERQKIVLKNRRLQIALKTY